MLPGTKIALSWPPFENTVGDVNNSEIPAECALSRKTLQNVIIYLPSNSLWLATIATL